MSWTPSIALRMRLRCGCVRDSSSVIRPSSMRLWTNVWSLVTWRISPSRKRYARLSPTCPNVSFSPSNSAMVAVVLVPLRVGSSSTSSAIRSLARWSAPATWLFMSSLGRASSLRS